MRGEFGATRATAVVLAHGESKGAPRSVDEESQPRHAAVLVHKCESMVSFVDNH